MVVAVTGATGFIGKALCKAILDKGWTLVKIGKEYKKVECDRVYHLACPSSTDIINKDPIGVMDTIIDGTKKAMNICPKALFINASSIGANDTIGDNAQACYNSAKRVMELYLKYAGVGGINYRLPSVYGEGMSKDSFIRRCIDGNAYKPKRPEQLYYIAHINTIIKSMIDMKPLEVEEITLGDIYEHFNSGRRGLHRPTPIP